MHQIFAWSPRRFVKAHSPVKAHTRSYCPSNAAIPQASMCVLQLFLAAIAMLLFPKQSTRSHAHDAHKEEYACNASRVSITHTPSAACRGLREIPEWSVVLNTSILCLVNTCPHKHTMRVPHTMSTRGRACQFRVAS